MLIRVKTMADFLALLQQKAGSELDLFYYNAPSSGPVSPSWIEDHTKFKFLLCTHTYSVVYSGNLYTSTYEKEYAALTAIQEKLNIPIISVVDIEIKDRYVQLVFSK